MGTPVTRSASQPPTGRARVARTTNPAALVAASVVSRPYTVLRNVGRYTPKATKPPKVMAYTTARSRAMGRRAAARNRVMNGSVAWGRLGASRPSSRKARPTVASPTATIRNAADRPRELATRGVTNPEMAVPMLPMP
jgi:hypothetical protein